MNFLLFYSSASYLEFLKIFFQIREFTVFHFFHFLSINFFLSLLFLYFFISDSLTLILFFLLSFFFIYYFPKLLLSIFWIYHSLHLLFPSSFFYFLLLILLQDGYYYSVDCSHHFIYWKVHRLTKIISWSVTN